MKTSLANKAALAIINAVDANPGMQFDAKNSTAQNIARVITEQTAVDELLAAAEQAQCACTIRERDSGHLSDCWMPDLTFAIEKAKAGAA